jgi:selenide,water dikinase
MGIIPEGDYANLNFCSKLVQISPEVSDLQKILLADAQTSGGFLICVPEELKGKFEKKALELGLYWVKAIGEVVEGPAGIEVLP